MKKLRQHLNIFIFFVLGFVLCLGQLADAQVTLRPYGSGSSVPAAGNARIAPGYGSFRVTDAGTSGIILGLPFFEDFTSYSKPNGDTIPHTSLWQTRSGTLVSNTLAKNYLNYYAVVLDGKDSSLVKYRGRKADSLVSNQIDLSVFKPKNLINLSFRYECGGNALRALTTNSLKLFFNYDSLGTLKWRQVWAHAGDSVAGSNTGKTLMDTTFLRVLIPLSDSTYFHNKFKFKFQSVSTDSIFFGTWHIDSIYITDAHLLLPFFDDFSENAPTDLVPYSGRWSANSGTQINNNYAKNPPTINYATFDGADANTTPYSSFSLKQGLGDSLVSRPINLKEFKQQDNLHLSFFYEAGGRGEMPDYLQGDSLVLSFYYSYAPDSIPGYRYHKDTLATGWQSMWHQFGHEGRPDSLNVKSDTLSRYDDTSFVYVNYGLTHPADSIFFHKGFRFKFQNYGKLAGNFDVWHVDYVYFDKNRSNGFNDKFISDRALNQFIKKPLKEYTAVPYAHFGQNPAAYLNDTISFTASNLSNNPNTLSVNLFIRDLDSANAAADSISFQSYFPFPMGIAQIGYVAKIPMQVINDSLSHPAYPGNIHRNQQILTTVKIPYANDSSSSNRLGIDLSLNNTISVITRLYEYYAFDDGVPEYSAEIDYKGLMAYRYIFPIADTITAIDINFSQNIKNYSGEQFRLVLWKKLKLPHNAASVKDQIIYVSDEKTVQYNTTHVDSLSDGFVRYNLPIPNVATAIVQDTIYIGYKQDSFYPLQIGYDYDENASGIDKIYSNVFGDWIPFIGEKGHLLIRPVFSRYDPTVITAGAANGPPADYPGGPNPLDVSIYTLYGVIPDSFTFVNVTGGSIILGITATAVGDNTQFNLSSLAGGMYIMTYTVGPYTYTKKIVKIK